MNKGRMETCSHRLRKSATMGRREGIRGGCRAWAGTGGEGCLKGRGGVGRKPPPSSTVVPQTSPSAGNSLTFIMDFSFLVLPGVPQWLTADPRPAQHFDQ